MTTAKRKDKDPTRFQCVVCGKITAGRWPRNPSNHRERGDGSVRFPRWHYVGQPPRPCDGNFSEARWVVVDRSRSIA